MSTDCAVRLSTRFAASQSHQLERDHRFQQRQGDRHSRAFAEPFEFPTFQGLSRHDPLRVLLPSESGCRFGFGGGSRGRPRRARSLPPSASSAAARRSLYPPAAERIPVNRGDRRYDAMVSLLDRARLKRITLRDVLRRPHKRTPPLDGGAVSSPACRTRSCRDPARSSHLLTKPPGSRLCALRASRGTPLGS